MSDNLNLNLNTNATTGRATEQEDRSNRSYTTNPEKSNKTMSAYDPFGHMAGHSVFGQLVNASTGSAGFNLMVETMRKALVDSKASDRLDIIPFPREVYGNLSYSVMVIVRNNKVAMGPGAPAHTFVTGQVLLIESTGEVPRPYTQDEHRRTWTVTPTSEDVYNRPLTTFLIDELKKVYAEAKNVYLIDPVIIRRTFDMANEERVKAQLVESQIAVETRSHTRVPNFVDFNYVGKLGSKDLQLPVSVHFNGGETHTDTQGLPIYTDAIVEVGVETIGSRNNRIPVPNSPDASKRLCQAGVMVDLVPVSPDLLEENHSRKRRNRDFVADVAWAPRAVVTLVEQYLARTHAGIFFALASVAELGRPRLWAQTFRPTKGLPEGQNLRDIGYLNIEANLDYANNDSRWGDVIDTAPGRFDDRDMEDLLDNTVTRFPMISVDCPVTGSQAYFTTVLHNIARGDSNTAQAAREDLFKSLRDATNGLIDEYIDLAHCDVLEDAGEMIHTGYWYDNAGKMRDIREIDNYLAIACRAGKNNPEMIDQWSATWTRTDIPEQIRMSDRLTYIQSAASGTVTVTGTALRATLNSNLISAFVKALEAGKLPLVSRDTGRGDQFQTNRSVSRVRESTLYRGTGFGGRDVTHGGARRGNSYSAERY